jgi:hypothetical protein
VKVGVKRGKVGNNIGGPDRGENQIRKKVLLRPCSKLKSKIKAVRSMYR